MEPKTSDNETFRTLSISDLYSLPETQKSSSGPIVINTTRVKVCGDPLTQIWWQGKQWAVTEYGIECRDGTYPIAAKKLTYDLDNGSDHGLIEQMCSKGWVDMNDFSTAYFVALSMHGLQLSSDKVKKLKRHFT